MMGGGGGGGGGGGARSGYWRVLKPFTGNSCSQFLTRIFSQ